MAQKIIILLILVFAPLHNWGQSNDQAVGNLSSIPQERLFVHLNNSFPFVGEYLYYKVYVLNASKVESSVISKLAYVELVGENNEVVFHHKLELRQGMGQGDFFIPVSIPSGNYKLLAYTKWMLNEGIKGIFQADIGILNPYQSEQNGMTQRDSTYQAVQNSEESSSMKSGTMNSPLLIQMDKMVYGNRQKVELSITPKGSASIQGNYSISVRKIDPLDKPARTTFHGFTQDHIPSGKLQNPSIWPEIRGEILSGSITSITEGTPNQNLKIAASFQGQNDELDIVDVDSQGKFNAILDTNVESDNVTLQILGEQRQDYRVLLDDPAHPSYSELRFHQFKIDKTKEDYIVARSLHNQVENRFYSAKPDSVITQDPLIPFYGNTLETFVLENFNKFSSVREVMVEIVDNVWVQDYTDKKSEFKIRPYDFGAGSPWPAMLLVDGVLLWNHEPIINLNPGNIKSFKVNRNTYQLGTQVFGGTLVVETIDGTFENPEYGNFILKTSLNPSFPHKNYYKQYYSEGDSSYDHIPDFRHQLLWKPDVKIESEGYNLDLYTSDVDGEFEVILEGFTTSGNAISLKSRFSVE